MVRRIMKTRKIRKTLRKTYRYRKPLKSIIGKMIRKNQEKKYHTYARTEYAVGGVGAPLIENLTLVPQGDTDITRDGDKLLMKTLRFNYMWVSRSSSPYPYLIRTLLVQSLESSTSYIPTVSTVLQSTGSDAQGIVSPYNHDNRYRHRILYDKVHQVSSWMSSVGVAAGTDVKAVRRNITVRIPKKWLQFSGGSTDSQNHIYLITFTYTQGGYTEYPYLTYCSKLNFVDS